MDDALYGRGDEEVEAGDDEEGEGGGGDEAADDGDGHGLHELGAFAEAEGEWEHAEGGGEGGHEDGAQADAAGVEGGGEGVEAAGAGQVDVFDEEDSVVDDDADEEDHAEEDGGAEAGVGKPEEGGDADEGEGDAGEDDDGVGEALVLYDEDDEDQEDGEEDGEPEGVAGLVDGFLLAAEEDLEVVGEVEGGDVIAEVLVGGGDVREGSVDVAFDAEDAELVLAGNGGGAVDQVKGSDVGEADPLSVGATEEEVVEILGGGGLVAG